MSRCTTAPTPPLPGRGCAPTVRPARPERRRGRREARAAVDKDVELPRKYTVRRRDTLWDIAEAYYGGGWRYRAIVRDNRRKIRNPHWIYAEQKFLMPDAR